MGTLVSMVCLNLFIMLFVRTSGRTIQKITVCNLYMRGVCVLPSSTIYMYLISNFVPFLSFPFLSYSPSFPTPFSPGSPFEASPVPQTYDRLLNYDDEQFTFIGLCLHHMSARV